MGIDINLAVRTKERLSQKILKELNYRFMEASDLGYGINPITIDDTEYHGGWFYYKVSTISRYYGEGYERGHFPEIYCAIEWLRSNIEGEVLYGGYYNFIEETPVFSKEDQEELMKHWCRNGGLPYRSNDRPTNELFRRLCPNCEQEMTQYMWSGNNGEINCLGCKHKEKTIDGGITWTILDKRNEN